MYVSELPTVLPDISTKCVISSKKDDNAADSSHFPAPVDVTYVESDLDTYTRWDKNNLFISASRCTSQLILVTHWSIKLKINTVQSAYIDTRWE